MVASNLGFLIHDADGDKFVMCTHAIYSEGNQCEILGAQIELTVKMALRLEQQWLARAMLFR